MKIEGRRSAPGLRLVVSDRRSGRGIHSHGVSSSSRKRVGLRGREDLLVISLAPSLHHDRPGLGRHPIPHCCAGAVIVDGNSFLEDRDRVPGRAGPAREAERQPDDHELAAPLRLACRGEVLELEAVGASMPMATIWSGWIGYSIPSTVLGTASPSPSGRNAAIRRSCIHGIVSTCRPALPSPGRIAVVPWRRARAAVDGGRSGRRGCRPRRAPTPWAARRPRARRGSPLRPARASSRRGAAACRAARRGRRAPSP